VNAFEIDMLRHYTEPHRTYHGVNHVLDLLDLYRGNYMYGVPQIDSETSLYLMSHSFLRIEHMIYAHDVVYDTGWSDNEELSARLYEDYAHANFLWPNSNRMVQDVVTGVRLSAGHKIPQSLSGSEPDLAHDVAIFLSLDLAQLAADWEKFNQNSVDIREEYSRYSDAQWREGRKKFFEGMLYDERPIFPFPICEKAWGEKARQNLRRGLAELN
jgi:predicted metal-dependent HD superfamily phosphohydrolase